MDFGIAADPPQPSREGSKSARVANGVPSWEGSGVGSFWTFVWRPFATLRRNHSALARIIEEATGIHHRADVTERLESVNLARVFHRNRAGVQINGHDIAGFQNVTQPLGDFAGIKLARGHAIAEEDARETFGQNHA